MVGTGRLRPAGDKNAWLTISPMQLFAISLKVKTSHLGHRVGASPRKSPRPQWHGPPVRAPGAEGRVTRAHLSTPSPTEAIKLVVNVTWTPPSKGHPCPTLGPSTGSSPGLPSPRPSAEQQPCSVPTPPEAPTHPLALKPTLSKHRLSELGFAAQRSRPHSAGSVRPPPLLPASKQDFTSQTRSDVWFPRHSRKGHLATAVHPPILTQLFWEVLLKAQPRGLKLQCHPLWSWERPGHKKGDEGKAGDAGEGEDRRLITLRLPRTPSRSTQLPNSRLKNLLLLSPNVQSQRSCINGVSVGGDVGEAKGNDGGGQRTDNPTPPPAVCGARA